MHEKDDFSVSDISDSDNNNNNNNNNNEFFYLFIFLIITIHVKSDEVVNIIQNSFRNCDMKQLIFEVHITEQEDARRCLRRVCCCK